MQSGAHSVSDQRSSLLRAPDDVNQNIGQGLWHFVSPFQGLFDLLHSFPKALPWAVMSCAFGAAFGLSMAIRG
jgi:hypothetical protein